MDKLELKNIAVEQGLDFDGVIELVFDAQQAKVCSLEEQVGEKAQEITNLKSLIQGHELRHQQNLSIKQKLTRRSEELQKRVDEITNIATELAEYASYAEIVGGVTVNRSAVRSFCDKVFDFNRKVDEEIEQALKG